MVIFKNRKIKKELRELENYYNDVVVDEVINETFKYLIDDILITLQAKKFDLRNELTMARLKLTRGLIGIETYTNISINIKYKIKLVDEQIKELLNIEQ